MARNSRRDIIVGTHYRRAHTRVAKQFNAKLANDRLSGRRGILARCTALISRFYPLDTEKMERIGPLLVWKELRKRDERSCENVVRMICVRRDRKMVYKGRRRKINK